VKHLFIAVLVAATALAACNPIYVNQDYDDEADFASYKTYAWVDSPFAETDPKKQNTLLEKRIRGWADEELAKKGMQRVEENPDLTINFVGDADEATEIRTTGTGMGLDRNTRAVHYEDGMVMIDMMDSGTKKLVWRGIAELTLSENPTTEEIDKRAHDAIRMILDQYPPKS